MKVRAKCNIKGSDGWHWTGEVFETDMPLALGDSVEILETEAPAKKEEPAKAAEPAPAKRTRKPKA